MSTLTMFLLVATLATISVDGRPRLANVCRSYTFMLNWMPNLRAVPDPCGRTEDEPSDCSDRIKWLFADVSSTGISRFHEDFRKTLTWAPDFCNNDSDGDGFTNGEELGDPKCEWDKNKDPKFFSKPKSHPAICEPVNSEKCVKLNGGFTCGHKSEAVVETEQQDRVTPSFTQHSQSIYPQLTMKVTSQQQQQQDPAEKDFQIILKADEHPKSESIAFVQTWSDVTCDIMFEIFYERGCKLDFVSKFLEQPFFANKVVECWHHVGDGAKNHCPWIAEYLRVHIPMIGSIYSKASSIGLQETSTAATQPTDLSSSQTSNQGNESNPGSSDHPDNSSTVDVDADFYGALEFLLNLVGSDNNQSISAGTQSTIKDSIGDHVTHNYGILVGTQSTIDDSMGDHVTHNNGILAGTQSTIGDSIGDHVTHNHGILVGTQTTIDDSMGDHVTHNNGILAGTQSTIGDSIGDHVTHNHGILDDTQSTIGYLIGDHVTHNFVILDDKKTIEVGQQIHRSLIDSIKPDLQTAGFNQSTENLNLSHLLNKTYTADNNGAVDVSISSTSTDSFFHDNNQGPDFNPLTTADTITKVLKPKTENEGYIPGIDKICKLSERFLSAIGRLNHAIETFSETEHGNDPLIYVEDSFRQIFLVVEEFEKRADVSSGWYLILDCLNQLRVSLRVDLDSVGSDIGTRIPDELGSTRIYVAKLALIKKRMTLAEALLTVKLGGWINAHTTFKRRSWTVFTRSLGAMNAAAEEYKSNENAFFDALNRESDGCFEAYKATSMIATCEEAAEFFTGDKFLEFVIEVATECWHTVVYQVEIACNPHIFHFYFEPKKFIPFKLFFLTESGSTTSATPHQFRYTIFDLAATHVSLEAASKMPLDALEHAAGDATNIDNKPTTTAIKDHVVEEGKYKIQTAGNDGFWDQILMNISRPLALTSNENDIGDNIIDKDGEIVGKSSTKTRQGISDHFLNYGKDQLSTVRDQEYERSKNFDGGPKQNLELIPKLVDKVMSVVDSGSNKVSDYSISSQVQYVTKQITEMEISPKAFDIDDTQLDDDDNEYELTGNSIEDVRNVSTGLYFNVGNFLFLFFVIYVEYFC